MIEKLTPEQVSRMPQYVKKWLDIGLSACETDHAVAEAALDKVYAAANLEPVKKIWFGSPLAAAKEVKAKKLEDSRIFGCHDAGWLSFYDFFYQEFPELQVTIQRLNGLMELARTCGWCWVYKEVAFMTPKPIVLHKNEKGLHQDMGPALSYPDGFSIFALNGILVPEWLVMTPANKLGMKEFKSLADKKIRREFIEKVGAEKLVEQFPKAIQVEFTKLRLNGMGSPEALESVAIEKE